MTREEYKPGHRLRVVGLPPNITMWSRPAEASGDYNRYLQNGDIITLIDPPTRDRLSFPGIFEMSGSGADFGLNYKGRFGADASIPADMTEVVAEDDDQVVSQCTCDIITLMAAGCTCGHLNKEKEVKS
jgi:hypothetical protein